MRGRSMRRLLSFSTTLLLLVGCFLTAFAESPDESLIDAIRSADKVGVVAALAQGADVATADPDGTTPLHWAVHANDPTIVKVVLSAGADADASAAAEAELGGS